MDERADNDPIGFACPICGTPALDLFGVGPCFCDNLDCIVLAWDPGLTLAEFYDRAQQIKWETSPLFDIGDIG